jgi:hypothetical protein
VGLRLRTGRVAAAALAAAVIAVLLPGAGTPATPQPTIAELRTELLAAIAAEKRALELLAKKPPRDGAAELQLDRSIDHLRRISEGLKGLSLPPFVANSIHAASDYDNQATGRIPPFNQEIREIGMEEIERALYEKNQALAALISPPPPGRPQCADGRDNDGDQLVDARLESGCTSSKDASEGSALACTLRSGASQVTGSCSGTFAKIELVAPSGVAFDTSRMPVAPQAELCRYSSPQRLECLMDDGAANPRHAVDLRFTLRSGSAARLRALIRDFAGRGRTFSVAPATPTRTTADLRVTARIDTAFLDKNGVGRVSGTVEVANAGPSEASAFRLLLTSNRVDSARAAELTSLPCARTETGVACTGPRVARGLGLAYGFGMPVNGAGQITVTFELTSATSDPSAANNRTTVQAELRPSP